MGYGKKLQEILESKNTNVRKLSFYTGIPATTLYSIIKRDGNIRLDYAIRISDALNINIRDITDSIIDFPSDFSSNPTISHASRKILESLNEKDFSLIYELLSNFYILDNDGREQILTLVNCMKKQQERKNSQI